MLHSKLGNPSNTRSNIEWQTIAIHFKKHNVLVYYYTLHRENICWLSLLVHLWQSDIQSILIRDIYIYVKVGKIWQKKGLIPKLCVSVLRSILNTETKCKDLVELFYLVSYLFWPELSSEFLNLQLYFIVFIWCEKHHVSIKYLKSS